MMHVYINGTEVPNVKEVDIVWTNRVVPSDQTIQDKAVQLEMKVTDEWMDRKVYIPADDSGNDDDWPLGHRSLHESVDKMIHKTLKA